MNTTPYFQRSIINLEASVLQHQEGRVGIAQLNWLIDFPGVNFFFVPLSNLFSYSIENSSFRRDKHQGLCYNDKVTNDINIIFLLNSDLSFQFQSGKIELFWKLQKKMKIGSIVVDFPWLSYVANVSKSKIFLIMLTHRP